MVNEDLLNHTNSLAHVALSEQVRWWDCTVWSFRLLMKRKRGACSYYKRHGEE